MIEILALLDRFDTFTGRIYRNVQLIELVAVKALPAGLEWLNPNAGKVHGKRSGLDRLRALGPFEDHPELVQNRISYHEAFVLKSDRTILMWDAVLRNYLPEADPVPDEYFLCDLCRDMMNDLDSAK